MENALPSECRLHFLHNNNRNRQLKSAELCACMVHISLNNCVLYALACARYRTKLVFILRKFLRPTGLNILISRLIKIKYIGLCYFSLCYMISYIDYVTLFFTTVTISEIYTYILIYSLKYTFY